MSPKKLRIGMLASNFIRIPPTKKYLPPGHCGAAEMVVSRITERLVEKGHKVTLFASGDSQTKAKLISVRKKASSLDPKIGIGLHFHYENLLISKAYQLAEKGKFDIIHSHFDIRSAGYAPLVKTPTVSNLNSPLASPLPRSYVTQSILKFYKNTQYYISISNAQRRSLPDLNYIATIHHGIDVNKFKPNFSPGEFLYISGRISPEKGFLEAIKIAKKSNEKLIITGTLPKPENLRKTGAIVDPKYQQKIKSLIDNKRICYLGFVSRDKLLYLLRHAKALLFPIKWDEPFGLMMIEAMASGTPVIAFNKGAVPEVIANKKTGFIVKDVNNAVKAVKKIDEIDRKECRKHVERKFTVEKMVDKYEEVYEKILERERKNR